LITATAVQNTASKLYNHVILMQ